jgi:hypothetical protein
MTLKLMNLMQTMWSNLPPLLKFKIVYHSSHQKKKSDEFIRTPADIPPKLGAVK